MMVCSLLISFLLFQYLIYVDMYNSSGATGLKRSSGQIQPPSYVRLEILRCFFSNNRQQLHKLGAWGLFFLG